MFQLSHLYMTTGKTKALTRWTFVSKVMSLLFNTLSRLVIDFLPRSSHLLISWLQSPYSVILEPKKRKSVTASTFSPSICHEGMELDAMILVSLILSFKPAFSFSSFIFIKTLFSSSLLSAINSRWQVQVSLFWNFLNFLSSIFSLGWLHPWMQDLQIWRADCTHFSVPNTDYAKVICFWNSIKSIFLDVVISLSKDFWKQTFNKGLRIIVTSFEEF